MLVIKHLLNYMFEIQNSPVNESLCYAIALIYGIFFNSLSLNAFKSSNPCQITCSITDNSVVYLSTFSSSYLMSIINSNNNNITIDKHFYISWYTKQSSSLQLVIMLNYLWSHKCWKDHLYIVSGRYLNMAIIMASNVADGFID